MTCGCCCYVCQSPVPDCCGEEFPRLVGVCCDGVWRTEVGVCCDDTWQTGAGTCCDGVWYTADGTCCDGVWHTDDGRCCDGIWYPDGNECDEGEVFVPSLGEGLYDCCICVAESVVAGCANVCCDGTGVYCGDDGGCLGSCCVDGVCSATYQADCVGEWSNGLCDVTGCVVACCSEDTDGNPTCDDTSTTVACEAPAVEAADCDTACLGECCDEDGVSLGQKTKTDCDDVDGYWAGVGSNSCQTPDECRSPFTESCCETKQSSGAGLVFTQPRNKRVPPFNGTLRVTATGTTDSPILIHGVRVGLEGKRCPFNVTFLLCWDKFNIEPIPCGTNFSKVDVTVCWEQEATASESLNFSACDGLDVWLGNSAYSCTTTLLYTGAGDTTDAEVLLVGDAVINSSGTGALVLSTAIAHITNSTRKLTLTGTNTDENEIGVINGASSGTMTVDKTGVGTWKLSGDSGYNGKLSVLSGTLIVVAVGTGGNSPFGSSTSPNPVIGDSSANAAGFAALLVDGAQVDRDFEVAALGTGATQTVTIGNIGTGTSTFTGAIFLNRSVILRSSSGGTAFFNVTWSASSVGLTIGSPGNDGTVVIENPLPDDITGITVAFGTLQTYLSNSIDPTTPVTVEDAKLYAFDDQSLDDLVINGDAVVEVESGKTLAVTDLSGAGSLEKIGFGELRINGANTFDGVLDITAGSVFVAEAVSGPAKFQDATLTDTTLTANFSSTPVAGEAYKLLYGPSAQAYTSITLTGGATGTWDASTSTLTIT